MDCRPDASIVHHFNVIALGSIMVGGDGFQDMELFGRSKRAWLEGFLDLSNGIPSHDTFGRVFSRLDPKQFHQCFLSWTQSVSELTQGMVVVAACKQNGFGLQTKADLGSRSLRIRKPPSSHSLRMSSQSVQRACKQRLGLTFAANSVLL